MLPTHKLAPSAAVRAWNRIHCASSGAELRVPQGARSAAWQSHASAEQRRGTTQLGAGNAQCILFQALSLFALLLALAGCSEPTRPPLSAYDSALSDLFDAPREDLPVADRAPEEPDGAPQDTDRTAPDAFPVAPEAGPDASDGSPPSPDGASLDAPADAPGAVDADGAVADSATMDSAERDSAAPDALVTEGSTMDLLVGEAPLLADAPLRDRGVRDTPSADTAPEDVGPSRGAPTVTILEPAAGATLSGAFTLRYTFTAPDGEDLLSVLVDGVEVASSDVFVTTLSLDTSRQAPGPHRLEVAITDRRGGRGAATVDVVYAPLPFRLLSVTPERDRYAPGETVVAVVTWDRPVPVFTADFSALDAAFDAARVAYTDEGDGRYTVRYPLSTTGTRADGRYHFSLTARDRATPPGRSPRASRSRSPGSDRCPSPLARGASSRAPGPRCPRGLRGPSSPRSPAARRSRRARPRA
jgi:hypothetical protein